MKDEQSQYPTHHLCYFCGIIWSDYYKEADWCLKCAEEIVAMTKQHKPKHRVICKQCEKPFETKYDRKVFCSHLCACAWHNQVNKFMMEEYKRMTENNES